MGVVYTVFLAGGIASGKSTVARMLEDLGAKRVDLDGISREVTRPGMPACEELARAFGRDVLDEGTGGLRRAVLAERAFASAEATVRLERIVHPHIRSRLVERLEAAGDEDVVVVEIPLLDRVEDLLPMADEVLCVTCPLATRRERAVGRGMQADDFDRRVAQQATDDYLVAHATTVFDNDGDEGALRRRIRDWWQERESAGWRYVCI